MKLAIVGVSVMGLAGFSPSLFAAVSAVLIFFCLVGVGVIGCAEDQG